MYSNGPCKTYAEFGSYGNRVYKVTENLNAIEIIKCYEYSSKNNKMSENKYVIFTDKKLISDSKWVYNKARVIFDSM